LARLRVDGLPRDDFHCRPPASGYQPDHDESQREAGARVFDVEVDGEHDGRHRQARNEHNSRCYAVIVVIAFAGTRILVAEPLPGEVRPDTPHERVRHEGGTSGERRL
jgi:hypothetical protein